MESPDCTIPPLLLTPRRPWITGNLGMLYDHPRARHRGIEVNGKVLEIGGRKNHTRDNDFAVPYSLHYHLPTVLSCPTMNVIRAREPRKIIDRPIDRNRRRGELFRVLGVTKGQECFYRAAIEEWNIWGMEEEEEEE